MLFLLKIALIPGITGATSSHALTAATSALRSWCMNTTEALCPKPCSYFLKRASGLLNFGAPLEACACLYLWTSPTVCAFSFLSFLGWYSFRLLSRFLAACNSDDRRLIERVCRGYIFSISEYKAAAMSIRQAVYTALIAREEALASSACE